MTRSTDRPSTSGRRSTLERRSRERRVLLVGLAASLVVHLVAILLISQWLTPRPADAPSRPGVIVLEPPPGMRAVEVRTVPAVPDPDPPDLERDVAAPARSEPEPEPERAPTPSPARDAVASAELEPDSVSAETRTAAERLSPRVVDPRLWRPMVVVPGEVTFEDVQARIAAAVELLSDSALAEADAVMRSKDWTVEDTKGGKWGISPGKIHLGSVVLPLPIFAVATPEQVAEDALWLELDHQLERALILESFEERVRAIRERRERERAAGRSGGSGGG